MNSNEKSNVANFLKHVDIKMAELYTNFLKEMR